MKATAALLWHTSSDFVNAVTAGAKDEFARLGIEVVADHRCRLRLGEADERHRDGAGQEPERHPRPAARPDHLGRRPSSRRSRPASRSCSCRTSRPATSRARTMSASSPTTSSRWASRRPTRSPRRSAEGQGRLDLPRRAVLRHQPARQRLQGDHREGLSRHRDRRRAGPRRPGAGRGDRQRAPHQEPRPRRHLRHLGGAGRGRPRGAPRGRQHHDQDRRRSTSPSRSPSTWSRTATSSRIIADEAYELGQTLARAAAAGLLIGKELRAVLRGRRASR